MKPGSVDFIERVREIRQGKFNYREARAIFKLTYPDEPPPSFYVYCNPDCETCREGYTEQEKPTVHMVDIHGFQVVLFDPMSGSPSYLPYCLCGEWAGGRMGLITQAMSQWKVHHEKAVATTRG